MLGWVFALYYPYSCRLQSPNKAETCVTHWFFVALSGKRVVQVACGSRDAQTLALTEEGCVYSWGDGDFGKLGKTSHPQISPVCCSHSSKFEYVIFRDAMVCHNFCVLIKMQRLLS